VSVTSSSSVILGSGVGPTVDGLTMVRIRGELLLYLTAASAINDRMVGAFGIGKVSASAFAIGVTAVETPVADSVWDGWLYHRFFSLAGATAITGGAAIDGSSINQVSACLRVEVDTKAMRKLDVEDRIYAALEVVEVGTVTMLAYFDSRALVKLA